MQRGVAQWLGATAASRTTADDAVQWSPVSSLAPDLSSSLHTRTHDSFDHGVAIASNSTIAGMPQTAAAAAGAGVVHRRRGGGADRIDRSSSLS